MVVVYQREKKLMPVTYGNLLMRPMFSMVKSMCNMELPSLRVGPVTKALLKSTRICS